MLETILLGTVGYLPFLAVALAVTFVFSLIHNKITPFDDKAELQSKNVPAGLVRGAAKLGILIAASGSLIMSDHPYWTDLGMFAADGLTAAVFVFAPASFVLDKVILPHHDNAVQVRDRNMAVAIAEAGSYVALGILMLSAFAGDGGGFWIGMISAVMWSWIGFAVLMAGVMIFKLRYRRRGCPVEEQLVAGDLGVGIAVATVAVATSLILSFSIIGDYEGLSTEIPSFAIAAASSLLAIAVIQFAVEQIYARKIVFDGRTYLGNPASEMVTGNILLGMSFIVGLLTFA